MDKYHLALIGLGLIVAVLVCAGLPACAQDNNSRSNSHQAVLHIRVNIVNTLMLSPVTQSHRSDDPVTYNVSAAKPEVEVSEEVRPLSSVTNGEIDGAKGAILTTTTVVAR